MTKQGVVQKEIREALKVVETLPPGRIFIVPIRAANHSLNPTA